MADNNTTKGIRIKININCFKLLPIKIFNYVIMKIYLIDTVYVVRTKYSIDDSILIMTKMTKSK